MRDQRGKFLSYMVAKQNTGFASPFSHIIMGSWLLEARYHGNLARKFDV